MSCSITGEFSSFRDPSGQVFFRDGVLYRQINTCYLSRYEKLMQCGLYDELQRFGALIPHVESEIDGITKSAALVIRPQMVPFVSYPYEWSFGQLKDAALLTLKLHRRALRHDMVLKDASAYNIQFLCGQPVLIDTLSFDFYEEGQPWGAYGQFCRHFLAPLLMMQELDLRLNRMLALYIDGIPLDLASELLGGKGGLFAKQHIHWHAKSVGKHAVDGRDSLQAAQAKRIEISKKQQLALMESLIDGIDALHLKNAETEWSAYYAHTNYSETARLHKAEAVSQFLDQIQPKTVWDLGANDGTYSKLALACGAHVVAFDIDPLAVERNYQAVKQSKAAMLPLVLDLTNPSPGIGFANKERTRIDVRQKPDCILALAVIHHLAISNNLPLPMLAAWFSSLSKRLIIEFVPKEDSQVSLLLATRPDIFPDYTQSGFEVAFSQYFILRNKRIIEDTQRTLYDWEAR